MYFNTCPTLLQEFKDDINDFFDNPKMFEGVMSSGTFYIAVYGRKISDYLKQFLPSYKSRDIFVPLEVINAEPKILREYLRAFYDDEGCASLRLNCKTKEWKRSITLASNSYKILMQIKELLSEQNITTNKIIRNKISDYDKTFVLSITGKENYILFQEKIGFKHPRKMKMLELIILSYNSTFRNKVNFDKLKKEKNKLFI